ncbi:hypothetical protein AB0I00_33060, partial [Streptomyces sp. NPDC050803]|uniref:hypothetical protein n=1 Tax=Streptomyces sp. NPDC050803 TaxID=3154635 RepID=UPI0034411966
GDANDVKVAAFCSSEPDAGSDVDGATAGEPGRAASAAPPDSPPWAHQTPPATSETVTATVLARR